MSPPSPASRRALVLGASGLVGSHLAAELGSGGWLVTGTYLRHSRPGLVPLDIARRDDVLDLVRRERPEVILCPAANPYVDLCEQEPEATRRINVGGTGHVVEAARDSGALMVYFSTDYVFDGEHAPYREEDACRPINEYGRQKVDAEELVRRHDRHIVARISAVYGWEHLRKNFVVRLIDTLRRRGRMQAWIDQVLTPTYAVNLARMVRELVEGGATGTFHVCGPQPIDRLNFSRTVCRVFGLDETLLDPVSAETTRGTLTPRPRNVGLSTEKLRRTVATAPLPPADGLAAMRDSAAPEPDPGAAAPARQRGAAPRRAPAGAGTRECRRRPASGVRRYGRRAIRSTSGGVYRTVEGSSQSRCQSAQDLKCYTLCAYTSVVLFDFVELHSFDAREALRSARRR
jgi:dTDP-4-dehydrorhamnose reductase